jgi:hypothetical protein
MKKSLFRSLLVTDRIGSAGVAVGMKYSSKISLSD